MKQTLSLRQWLARGVSVMWMMVMVLLPSDTFAQQNIPPRVPQTDDARPPAQAVRRSVQPRTRDVAIPPRRSDADAPPPPGPDIASRIVDARVYQPRYAPEVITLTPEQVETIRTAAISRTLADHQLATASANEQIARHQYETQQLATIREDETWASQHRRDAYERHAADSVWIFALTLVIVALGLLLTVWQFTREQRAIRTVLRPLTHGKGTVDEAAYRQALELLKELRGTTNLKLGSAGIELGTQLIGLVVLAFSLGFFYLFLIHVYPLISE